LTNQTFVSKDVVFHKHVFPYQDKATIQYEIPLVMPLVQLSTWKDGFLQVSNICIPGSYSNSNIDLIDQINAPKPGHSSPAQVPITKPAYQTFVATVNMHHRSYHFC